MEIAMLYLNLTTGESIDRPDMKCCDFCQQPFKRKEMWVDDFGDYSCESYAREEFPEQVKMWDYFWGKKE
jgi:hypothetical protein